MIWVRAFATLTRASYSRPFFAMFADSTSTSTPLPSARRTWLSCSGEKLVASIVCESPDFIACASAEWKSTSLGGKRGDEGVACGVQLGKAVDVACGDEIELALGQLGEGVVARHDCAATCSQ